MPPSARMPRAFIKSSRTGRFFSVEIARSNFRSSPQPLPAPSMKCPADPTGLRCRTSPLQISAGPWQRRSLPSPSRQSPACNRFPSYRSRAGDNLLNILLRSGDWSLVTKARYVMRPPPTSTGDSPALTSSSSWAGVSPFCPPGIHQPHLRCHALRQEPVPRAGFLPAQVSAELSRDVERVLLNYECVRMPVPESPMFDTSTLSTQPILSMSPALFL